jgi:sulfotransferase 6B1
MARDPIQLRGRLRWKVRRMRTIARDGLGAINELPIVFGNGIPKSGSTLLFNILRGLDRLGPFVNTGLNSIKPYLHGEPTPPIWIKDQLDALGPGDIRFGYLYPIPENIEMLRRDNLAHFFIVRDPRDAIISSIYWALEVSPRHNLRQYYTSLPSMEEIIFKEIDGFAEGALRLAGVQERYERWLGWLEQPDVLILRFEDLISQRKEQLVRCLDFLEIYGFKPTISRAAAIAVLEEQTAPKKADTFRKGKAGGWREHFTDRNIERFKKSAGDLLIRLGYEDDLEW